MTYHPLIEEFRNKSHKEYNSRMTTNLTRIMDDMAITIKNRDDRKIFILKANTIIENLIRRDRL
jgi:hypothetical protein